jgi:hypothetical protein
MGRNGCCRCWRKGVGVMIEREAVMAGLGPAIHDFLLAEI